VFHREQGYRKGFTTTALEIYLEIRLFRAIQLVGRAPPASTATIPSISWLETRKKGANHTQCMDYLISGNGGARKDTTAHMELLFCTPY
jgi:hypothetical protein